MCVRVAGSLKEDDEKYRNPIILEFRNTRRERESARARDSMP